MSFFVSLDKLKETADIASVITSSSSVDVADNAELFKEATKDYFFTFLLIFISGMSVYLIPVSVFAVLLRGLKCGLSSALIIRSLGARGIIFSIVNTLIKNFLFAPVFIVLAVVSIRQALKTRQIKPIKNQNYIAQKIAEFVFIILISAFLGGFESYFISLVN